MIWGQFQQTQCRGQIRLCRRPTRERLETKKESVAIQSPAQIQECTGCGKVGPRGAERCRAEGGTSRSRPGWGTVRRGKPGKVGWNGVGWEWMGTRCGATTQNKVRWGRVGVGWAVRLRCFCISLVRFLFCRGALNMARSAKTISMIRHTSAQKSHSNRNRDVATRALLCLGVVGGVW